MCVQLHIEGGRREPDGSGGFSHCNIAKKSALRMLCQLLEFVGHILDFGVIGGHSEANQAKGHWQLLQKGYHALTNSEAHICTFTYPYIRTQAHARIHTHESLSVS